MYKFKLICLCLFFLRDTLYAESHKLTAMTNAIPEEFPHQAVIHGGEWLCGAVIITKEFVLAPAQCLNGSLPVKVFLGYHTDPLGYSDRIEITTQFRISNEIMFHENYHKLTKYGYINDIALVKLPEPATFNSRIQPGVLMSKEEAHLLDEEYATVSGWLSNKESDMQFATQQILDPDTCRYHLKKDFFESQEICTKSASINPLDMVGNNIKVNGKILGYLTQAYSPCKSITGNCNGISVFLKIPPYLNWISEKVGVSVANLTGRSEDNHFHKSSSKAAANTKEKMKRVSSQLDKIQEKLNALKAEMEIIKN